MKKIVVVFLFIIVSISIAFSQEANAYTPKNIFILHSYHISQKWVTKFTKGYCPYINNDTFNLYVEQLNEKRIPFTPEIGDVLIRQFNTVYKNTQFDLIVVIDNAALDFMNTNIHLLDFAKDVPIMAAGINDFDSIMIKNIPYAMVLREEGGFEEILSEISRLMPHLDTIYCIIDYTETGKIIQGLIKEKIESVDYQSNISKKNTVLFNENQLFEEVLQDIKKLSKNSAILLILYQRDAENNYLHSSQVLKRIFESTNLPIFCGLDIYMHEKVIGGRITNPENLGIWLGKSIIDYFNGDALTLDIAYAKKQLEWAFSYPALKKHKIPISQLPPDSKLYFKPLSFFAQYKKISFFLLITVIITLIIIAIFYIFNKKLSKQVRKQTQNIENLVQNFEYLRDNMPIGFIELNEKYCVTYWNKSAELIFGYSSQETENKPLFDLIVLPENRAKAYAVVETLLKKSETIYISDLLHHKLRKDEKIKCEWYFTRKKDEKSNSILYMCMVRDITESEKLKHDQAKLVNVLKKMMHNQDRFIATSMHDIKNIMAPIVAYSEMMSLYDLPQEKVKDLANRMHKSTNLLSNVFVEMMDISRVKGELLDVVPREFSIKEITGDIAAMLEENFKRKEINFLNLLPEQAVYADYEMIYSTLMNLLTNAVKFTPHKGEVAVRGKIISNTHFEVQVKDNGVGIDIEKFNLMLSDNKYFTTKGTAGEEGTGLGLLLCKELIANNFGTFQAKINETGGSSFFFTIPLSEEVAKIKNI